MVEVVDGNFFLLHWHSVRLLYICRIMQKPDVLYLSSELFQIELTSISVCPCPKGELFLDIGAKRPAIGGRKF